MRRQLLGLQQEGVVSVPRPNHGKLASRQGCGAAARTARVTSSSDEEEGVDEGVEEGARGLVCTSFSLPLAMSCESSMSFRAK